MKKTYYLLLTFVSLLTLASCDDTASESKFDHVYMEYYDKFHVSLYVPDLAVENDPLCKDSMLCTAIVSDTIAIVASNQGDMGLAVGGLEDIRFQLPFLNADGTVRTIFKDGIFAKLYTRMKAATDQDPTLQPYFSEFKKNVEVIKDTINLSNIMTFYVPCSYLGAALITWDSELNSNYVSFGSYQSIVFERRSSIFNALRAIQPLIEQWAAEGKLTPAEIAELKKIQAQKSGTSPMWGWMTVKAANARMDADIHIEPEYLHNTDSSSEGMLDYLSIALFGRNALGRPNKPVWFNIRFNGNALAGSDYVPVE